MRCNVNMSLISSFLLDKKYSNMTHIPDIILKSSSNVTIATMKEFRQPYWTLIFKVLTTTYGITVTCANTKRTISAISRNMFKSSMKD